MRSGGVREELRREADQEEARRDLEEAQGFRAELRSPTSPNFSPYSADFLFWDQNNAVRALNGLLRLADQKLQPLFNPTIGKPIPGFPQTSAALAALIPNALIVILRALG